MHTANGVATARRTRRGPVLAVVLSCVFFGVLVAAYVLKAIYGGFIADDAVFALSMVCAQAVGLLLAVRRPDNRVAWIVCGLAWSMSAQEFVDAYGAAAVSQGWPFTWALWVGGKSFLLLWAGVMALFLYFPTGALPSPRWRPVAGGVVGVLVFGLVTMALAPGPLLEDVPPSGSNPMNPTALPAAVWDRLEFLNGVALVLLLVVFVLSVAALVTRYRSSSGVQRLQIRWVVAASVAFGAVMIVGVAVRHLAPQWLVVADLVAGLGFTLLPLSVAVAILRFRLYEIDRVINRSVVYTVLTLVLGAAYLAVVSAMRAVTAPLTGDTAIAVAGSTLAVAALFRPARRRIQDEVDRRFNRARYDAAATVARFSTRLRDEVDLDTLSGELVAVVRATMQPTTAVLWLR